MVDVSFPVKKYCAQVIDHEHLNLSVGIEFLDAVSREPFFQMDATDKDADGNYHFSAHPVLRSLPQFFSIRFTGKGQSPVERDWPPSPLSRSSR